MQLDSLNKGVVWKRPKTPLRITYKDKDLFLLYLQKLLNTFPLEVKQSRNRCRPQMSEKPENLGAHCKVRPFFALCPAYYR